MKNFVYLFICFWSVHLMAQTDSIPKKNKERKFHAGIFYSLGISYLNVSNESGVKSESNAGSYQNWGLMVETKIYKNFWLELNANRLLSRNGQINFIGDTTNIDMQIRNGIENTILLYIKYKVLQKSKVNLMAKAGLGFGTIFSRIYTKNNISKQTQYSEQFATLGNMNYYSFSIGFDANYQLNKHITLFNQFTYNWGMNILKEYYLGVRTNDSNNYVLLNEITPQTIIYSLGIKF